MSLFVLRSVVYSATALAIAACASATEPPDVRPELTASWNAVQTPPFNPEVFCLSFALAADKSALEGSGTYCTDPWSGVVAVSGSSVGQNVRLDFRILSGVDSGYVMHFKGRLTSSSQMQGTMQFSDSGTQTWQVAFTKSSS